ncbi:MAG: hypothetical protein K8U57_27480 [Planctomycetes bacterium]|nr:hypothetical protein [Planctomycetota bacterium]
MQIDKSKLASLAADCHVKQTSMQSLHMQLQKGGTPEMAGLYPIAKVEYQRAKNLLDLEVKTQSVTIIKQTSQAHASDCAVHNAPALPVGPCDCDLSVRESDPA